MFTSNNFTHENNTDYNKDFLTDYLSGKFLSTDDEFGDRSSNGINNVNDMGEFTQSMLANDDLDKIRKQQHDFRVDGKPIWKQQDKLLREVNQIIVSDNVLDQEKKIAKEYPEFYDYYQAIRFVDYKKLAVFTEIELKKRDSLKKK